jgi:membrane protein
MRPLARDVLRGLGEHDLLTFASAIAFQVMTAIVPLVMSGVALLGVLHLDEAWTQHLAPQLRHSASPQVFALADSVVRRALGSKQIFWLTAGIVICLWEVSGGVRAVMSALSRIYGDEEKRPKRRRYAISFALALAAIVLGLGALAVFRFAPNVLHGPVVSVARWPVAFALLTSLAWLLLRFAPVESHADHWVSIGSVICVIAWLVASLGFGFYVNNLGHYRSIFSSLAALFLLLTYLYISACAFLIGAQTDALLRERRTGSKRG